jgi:hypothetical protein
MKIALLLPVFFSFFSSNAQKDTIIFYSGEVPRWNFLVQKYFFKKKGMAFLLMDQKHLPAHLETLYDTLLNTQDSSLFSGVALFTTKSPKCENQICSITRIYCLYENGKKLNCNGATYSRPENTGDSSAFYRSANYSAKYDQSGTTIIESCDTNFTNTNAIRFYHTFEL